MGIQAEEAREQLQGTDKHASRKGCGKGCKICAVISVILAVVLAVAVPVGIFVVGPRLAQKAMDEVVLHVKNSSVYGLPDVGIPSKGTINNTLVMHNPMGLGATLEETVVTMIADQWVVTPDLGFTNGPIGNFTMPRTQVKHGDNEISFTKDIFFNTTADHGFRFTFWGFMVLQTEVARIRMVAEPKVRAFGLTFHAKLNKSLVCNCIPGSTGCIAEKPDPTTTGNARRLARGIATVEMFCEPEGVNIWNASEVDSFFVV